MGKDSPTVNAIGRQLAGELCGLLPLILSPWFVVSSPGVSLNEIRAAANGQLPDTVGFEDVASFVVAARSGGANFIGLLHSLGYVRGLLQDLGFQEGRRLASMLKFAMLGDVSDPLTVIPQELNMGQWMRLCWHLGCMECQVRAMAPLARAAVHCEMAPLGERACCRGTHDQHEGDGLS